MAEQTAEAVAKQVATQVAERVVAGDLDRRIMEFMLAEHPRMQLSRAGFETAFYVSLKRHWRDVKRDDAARWCWEAAGAKYGAKGYAWDAAGADELAREYAAQFGEAA